MKFHEYANIYRMLPDAELANLAEDIKAKGQLLPITSYEGQVLDGRNRYRACEIAGVDPKIDEYTGDDPLGLIASLNDHRRHDSDNERAIVGAKMASLKRGGDAGVHKSNSPSGLLVPAVTQERAAELAGTSVTQLKRAKKAMKDCIPEIVEMMETEEISMAAAELMSQLPKEDQREALDGGVKGVKDAAKKLKLTKKKSADSSPPPESPNVSPSTPQTNGCDGSVKSGQNDKPNKFKVIQTSGMATYAAAKQVMETLAKNDTHWREALEAMISYCQGRLTNKK